MNSPRLWRRRSLGLISVLAMAAIATGALLESRANAIYRRFLGIEGVNVNNLTLSANFQNNAPDAVEEIPRFEYDQTNPNIENFGGQLLGYFRAPVTGQYQFNVSADDAAEFWISSDDKPYNKVLAARQLSWSGFREFATQSGGLPLDPARVSPMIQLEGGRRYYIEGLYKEGNGGDNFSVTYRNNISTPWVNGTPGLSEVEPFEGAAFDVIPRAQTVAIGRSVSFTAHIVSAYGGEVTWQWYRGPIPLDGETSATFEIPVAGVGDDGAIFSVRATVNGQTYATDPVRLTVITDALPPTITAVRTRNFHELHVTFSEGVTGPAGANLVPANFLLNNGATVTAVDHELAYPNRAILTVAGVAPGSGLAQGATYTLRPISIFDLAGNQATLSATVTPVFTHRIAEIEYYRDIGNDVTIGPLTSHPKFKSAPDEVAYNFSFGGGADYIGVNNGGIWEQYGASVHGFFVAPRSGQVIWYMSSDDHGELWVSSDENPANVVLAAREPAWNGSRQWLATDRRPNRENVSGLIDVLQGRRYYLELLFKEGSGGDSGAATVIYSDEPEPANGSPSLQGAALGIVVNGAGRSIAFTAPVTSEPIIEGRGATLSGGVSVSPAGSPVGFQWQVKLQGSAAFTDIPNANSSTLTIGPLSIATHDNAIYRLLAFTLGATAQSDVAIDVVPDTTPPVPLAASAVRYGNEVDVGITFNELVDPVSAATLDNYIPSAGVALSVAYFPQNNAVSVRIGGLSGSGPFGVTVRGVRDPYGNVAPNPGVSLPFTVGPMSWVGVGGDEIGLPEGVVAVGPNGFDAISGGSVQWDSYDESTFIYEAITGDFDRRVRVAYQEPSSRWARAGLMMRENLDAGKNRLLPEQDPLTEGFSRYQKVHVYPATTAMGTAGNNNHDMYRRLTRGGLTDAAPKLSDAAPAYPNAWVRLKREGDVLTMYRRSGVQEPWVLLGTTTMPGLAPTVFVGPDYGPEVFNVDAPLWRSYMAQFRDYGPEVPHDELANARTLEGPLGTVSGSNAQASLEPGEPVHLGTGGRSIWHRWTARGSGQVQFNTAGSDYDTLLAVYTGEAANALTLIAENDDALPNYLSAVSFAAVAGTTYYIAVDGYFGAEGNFNLNWNFNNDPFASSFAIVGTTGTVFGSNAAADIEAGEPSWGGASIWFHWTAPATGPIRLTTAGSDFDTILNVFTGNQIGALQSVTANDDTAEYGLQSAVEFFAVEGVTYRIAVTGYIYDVPSRGTVQLNWNGISGTDNDFFLQSQALSGPSGTFFDSNAGATLEAGEAPPAVGSSVRSIWFHWTAPASGPVVFDTFRSGIDTALAVSTGSTVWQLTQVAANDNAPTQDNHSRVMFEASAGVVYHIAVAGVGASSEGFVALNWGRPVANDLFSAQQDLSGASGSVAGSNVAAALEIGEPDHYFTRGGRSIWYRWTAPFSAEVRFDTAGSNFDTLLSVYTGGSVDALTVVAENDDFTDLQSRVTFNAIAGVTYRIAVDGYNRNYGAVTLNWYQTGGVVNDGFAGRAEATGLSGSLFGSNVGAGVETGEPNHGAGSTVWYRWTAPATGAFQVDTGGSSFDTVLAIYGGEALEALTPVGHNDDATGIAPQSRVVFFANAGANYVFMVGGSMSGGFPAEGAIVLNWLPVLGSDNNYFGQSQAITGASGVITDDNFGADHEDSEPIHGGQGAHSLWYRWTAPSAGSFYFDTAVSPFDTLLAVYTGRSLSLLTQVAVNDNTEGVTDRARVIFTATAGTVYHIAVDGLSESEVVLNWGPEIANDRFANAQTLSGPTGTISGSNVGAALEAGEKSHLNGRGRKSVWYRWTAPISGEFQFDTAGSSYDTLLSIYTGEAVESLTVIAENDDVPGSLTSGVAFNAEAGVTYQIAVDGYLGSQGNILLNWRTTVPVNNDFFATPHVISGFNGVVDGNNVGATTEPGEIPFGGGSMWYQWTAPGDGVFQFDTIGSSFDTVLAIYRGDGFPLQILGVSDDIGFNPVTGAYVNQSSVGFLAQEDVTYRIAVSGYGSGNFTLHWAVATGSDNNFFDQALVISGPVGSVEDSNVGTSYESGEPLHAGVNGERSIWFRWEAPATGTYSFDTEGSGFDTLLAVYLGPSLVNMTEVRSNNDISPLNNRSRVVFPSVGGVVYNIAVDGVLSNFQAEGSVRLNWRLETAAPLNDAFASAQSIAGASGSVFGTSYSATLEPQEPLHLGGAGGSSIWYRWVAPSTGLFRFETSGSSFDTMLSVYQGAALPGLALIAENNNGPIAPASQLDFAASAGQSYFIAVSGFLGAQGAVILNWWPENFVFNNDFFATPELITGPRGTFADSNVGATRELGEPLHAGVDGNRSLWFRWVAPSDGQFTFDTIGSSVDTALAIYRGSAFGELNAQIVAANNDMAANVRASSVTFAAISGFVYVIAVDGVNGPQSEGGIVLNWAGQNALPSISLVAPQPAAVFYRPAPVLISAQASDADGAVSRVEFYADDLLLGALLMPNDEGRYTFEWTTAPLGESAIFARVIDDRGGSVDSERRTITMRLAEETTQFAWAEASRTFAETAGTIQLTVRKTGGAAASVNYTTVGGTDPATAAVEGRDYSEATGTLDFTASDTVKTVTVHLLNEYVADGVRKLEVHLSGPSNGAVLGTPSVEEIVITDDDDAAGGSRRDFRPSQNRPSTDLRSEIFVTLTPAAANGQWRFRWERTWRDNQTSATDLDPGSYQIEFRPRLGYLTPLPQSITLGSGVDREVTADYQDAPGQVGGSLRVTFEPMAPGGVPRWRLVGDTAWRGHDQTLGGLPPGLQVVEFERLAGWTTPTARQVLIQAGITSTLSVAYVEEVAVPLTATTPYPLTYSDIRDGQRGIRGQNRIPYPMVGQIRSSAGFGTGIAVRARVVLTAAHVLFDETKLDFVNVSDIEFFQERSAGEYDPRPMRPRGFYVPSEYRIKRIAERNPPIGMRPGQAGPDSQQWDVAAIYFDEDVARGGQSGFLASDAANNEWFGAGKQKQLVGYPLMGGAADGRMHETRVRDFTFTPGERAGLFLSSGFLSFGGNSGGPLLVGVDELGIPCFYPAGVYLGNVLVNSVTYSVVRAIDRDVVTLINRAQSSAELGVNFLGGAFSQVGAGDQAAGTTLRVRIEPADAVTAGAGWRVGNSGAYHPSGFQDQLFAGNYTLEFADAAGFLTPAPRPITVTADVPLDLPITYNRIANAPPTIGDVANVTIDEDTATAAIAFAIGDAETDAGSLALTKSSSNPGLIPDTAIVLGGAGAARTVQVTPLPNQFGNATITLTVTDGASATATDTFVVTVTPVNDLPVISAIGDVTIDEDNSTAALSFTIGDVESGATLTLTRTTSNAALVPAGNIAFAGAGPSRTVTVTPLPNQSGEATIGVVATDADGGSSTETFVVRVNPRNDPPTISEVANVVINEDTATAALAVGVGDVETPAANLLLTRSSSNQALVPDANIVLGGAGANRTVTVTPAANQSGSATITLTVADESNATAIETFVVQVNPVNDLPTISAVSDLTIAEDSATGALAFTIQDVETPAASLAMTAASSNPSVVPNANIVFGGAGANRTVTVTPAANRFGPATITLTVTDLDGGFQVETFIVTVTPGIDPPTISNVGDTTIQEDGVTSEIAVTIGDVETPAGNLTLAGSSSNPTIVPNANIVFGGAGANRTVTVRPAANQFGSVTITLTVTDADAGSATDVFVVNITPVNDLPTISNVADVSVDEDTPTPPLAVTIGDVETPAASLTLTATSSDTALVPNANIVLGGAGANRTVTVTPLPNQNGSTTITLTVADAENAVAIDTFVVQVNGGIDPPTISNVLDVTIDEDTATAPLAVTVGDLETPAADLTLTGSSSNPLVVPNANIVFGGAGANRTVTVTPAPNQNGPVIISVTVRDTDGSTATDTFVLRITPRADPPAISPVADVTSNEDAATAAIAFAVSDPETPADELTVIASSSNTTLAPDANVVLGGSGANRTVTVTPAPNRNGSTTITLTVADGEGLTAVETFVVTVTPANDLPTISNVADVTIDEDASAAGIAVTIGDLETAAGGLGLTASSSNTELIPNAAIVPGGAGANRTVTVTPAPNRFGQSTITLTVTDANGGTATDTFVVQVTPINDPPTVTGPADVSIDEDSATAVLAVNIGDVDSPLANLTLSAASSAPAIVPDANIVLGGAGASRTVQVTPLPNQNGPVTITLTVRDDAGATGTDTFVVQIVPVNDLPTISSAADVQILEDTVAGPIAVTIGDLETPAAELALTAASSNPAVIPIDNIVFGGAGANRTVTITPAPNANGPVIVTVTVTDLNGGTARDSFVVNVGAVIDPPSIRPIADLAIDEDTVTGPIAVEIDDPETPAAELTIIASSSNTTLVPNANVVLGGAGRNRTISITPAANRFGQSTITLTVVDEDGEPTIETFVLQVRSINDEPTISAIADVSVAGGATPAPIAFAVGDIETAAADLVPSGLSSNTALVPNANIVFGGAGANRTVTITPAANQSGTATITVTIADAGNATAVETFDFTVTGPAPRPTVSAVTMTLDRKIRFSVDGAPGQRVTVESTVNFIRWDPVRTDIVPFVFEAPISGIGVFFQARVAQP